VSSARFRGRRLAVVAAVLAASGARPAAGQVALCEGAELFMAADMGMAAVTEPDRIDDWRTKQMVTGCRVTAAGLTRLSLRDQAAGFYERLRAAGWARTPDPRDAPNESSLRFRKDGVDCLFSFYSGGLLGTEAEDRVDDARVPGPGERRFNFIVQCMPASDAAPRDTTATGPTGRMTGGGRRPRARAPGPASPRRVAP